jgi:geranylgeranyl diphosphate synthase type II
LSSRSYNTVQLLVAEYLLEYRELIIKDIQQLIDLHSFQEALALRLSEYPLRAGKGLRPALCFAMCQANGGEAEEALPSATALELFHNAFLVHDDIEDESLSRRGDPTIHQKYGIAIAVNVGDALNVLTMTPLLKNLEVIGLEKTLRVFKEIERMGRESVEGQAMELEWVKKNEWKLDDHHYHLMTQKKTCWYTCITPCRIGAIIGAGNGVNLEILESFGRYLGIAFQIQDDLLNLVADEVKYGKENAGDIWEGKRTLMLIDLIKKSSTSERKEIINILSKDRSNKNSTEIEYILDLMRKYGSLDYGRDVAKKYAKKAKQILGQMNFLEENKHKHFLEGIIDYVIHRDL